METETQDSDFEIAIKALARIQRKARVAGRQAVKLDEKIVFSRLARDIEKMRMDLIQRVFEIEDAEKLAKHD